MKKKLWTTLAVVVALLVLVAALLPLFINADAYRPEIQARLDAALGRQVTLGHLGLSVYRGDLKAGDIAISDDPSFGSGPFLRAKSLEVGVELLPLIFSHALRIKSISIKEPQVVLLRSASGKWNFSTMGPQQGPVETPVQAQAQASASGASSAVPDFSVQKLDISDGRVTLGTAGSPAGSPAAQTYEDVNISAENVSFTSSFPFKLEARAPGGGTVALEGKAGPVNAQDTAQTPFQANIKLQQVNLASVASVDSAAGIAGAVDYDGSIHSDGKLLHADGTATISRLQLVKNGGPAKQPIAIRYSVDYDVVKQTGQLTSGQLTTGKSTVSLSGSYDKQGGSTTLHLKLDAPSVPVGDIQALLPAIGVTLPSGASLQGGTAETHLLLDGPVDQMVTTGNVKFSNVKLAGFGLDSKLAALSAFTGIRGGNDTLIQVLSANVRMAADGIRLNNINMVVPDLGTLAGAGAIAPNNALNFPMTASIAGGGAVAGLASHIGLGGAAGGGIPFLIEGTASNPQFRLNTKAMARSGLSSLTGSQGGNQPATFSGIVQGLLGGQK